MTSEPDRQLLEHLARVGDTLGAGLGETRGAALLTAVTDAVRTLFDAAACSVALLDEDGEVLEFAAASGAGAEEIVGVRLPVSRGIAGWAVTTGQAITVDRVGEDQRFAREVAEATGYLPRTLVAYPLETDERTLGVLEILDPGAAGDAALLAPLARLAALAIDLLDGIDRLGRALLRRAAAGAHGDVRAGLETALAGDVHADPETALEEAGDGRAGPETAVEEAGDHGSLVALVAALDRAGAAERRTAARLLATYLDDVARRGALG